MSLIFINQRFLRNKQEEMQKLKEDADAPPLKKVNRIKYERSIHSILNKPNIRTLDVRINKTDGDNNINYSPMIGDRHDFKGSNHSHFEDPLDTVPEHVAKYETTFSPVHNYNKSNRSKSSFKRSERKRYLNHSMNHSSGYQPKPFIKFDYLAEMRNKKLEGGGYDYKAINFWNSDIKDSKNSNIEKYLKIKLKTDDLERKAKIKENHLGIAPGSDGMKYSQEVSSMYMDAIKAKAALLSNL